MASRRDWLAEGLAVLAADGAPALTIERLSGRLGLTKGSFYHHFKSMAGFRAALLEFFETECTTRFIAAVEQAGGSPRAKLELLLELVLTDQSQPVGLEVAMRAWALQDGEARATQERVDRVRLDYLGSVWQEFGGAAAPAVPMARLLYLVLIGAEQVIPPLPASDVRDLYQLAFRLVPGAGRGPG